MITPPESWYPFFEWCESTFIGGAIQSSIWLFPVIEATHLVALCVMGGALIVGDLRMLGFGMTRQRIPDLVRLTRPWFVAGLGVMLTTGVLLFLSEAVKCYYNSAFWLKITTLPFAIAFVFLVRNRVGADDALETSAKSRLVGLISIALWVTVAAAGRWIGYS